MSTGELLCRQRRDDGQFAGQDQRRTDFGKRRRMTITGESKDIQTRPLAGQPGAATDSSNNQGGQGNRRVQVTLIDLFHPHDADRRLGNAGNVLPAGEK